MNLNDTVKASEELRLAMESGDADTIAQTVVRNAWPLYNFRYERAREAVNSLPTAVLERYPVVRMIHPLTPVLAHGGNEHLAPLLAPGDIRGMSAEQLSVLFLAQMVAHRLSGDVATAMGYAQQLRERIEQVSVDALGLADGPLWFLHHQIGSTMLAAGDTSGALREFATTRQLGLRVRQPHAERMALGREALTHALRGSFGEAVAALGAAQQLPLPTAPHLASAASTESTAEALIAVERMTDIDAKLAALEPTATAELVWPFIVLARARAFIARQQPEHALEVIRYARNVHPPQRGSIAADIVISAEIEALLAAGDVTAARRVAEAAGQRGLLTRLARIRIALHSARLDAAVREIAAVTADHQMGPAPRAELAFLSAWLEWARTGALDKDVARRLFTHAQGGGARRIIATMPRQFVAHVEEVLEPGDAAEFAKLRTGLDHPSLQTRPPLTPGELRVLNALTRRGTTAEIAAAFHVSPNTIKSQLKSLYRKLGCSTREEAINAALRLHLIRAAGDIVEGAGRSR